MKGKTRMQMTKRKRAVKKKFESRGSKVKKQGFLSKVKSKLKRKPKNLKQYNKRTKSASELHAEKRKKIGASKDTRVSKGAVGLKKTKGGEYVKYEKKSRAAGSFRKAFKTKCAGGAKGFTWQGRKYSCAKK
tara:strand:+ start:962 stop:1357 length:396 start_codon:yes stop_codon:yes gene_type:complete